MPALRPGTPEEAGVDPARVTRIRQRAAQWMAAERTPSLVMIAARRGVIFLHEAFGRLHPGEDAPPLPLDAVFPMASASKPVTAAVLMTLVEEGRVALNRSVADYLPELGCEGIEEVTLHHLLTHTSGWDDDDLMEWSVQRARQGALDGTPMHPDPLIASALATRCDAPRTKVIPGEMVYCSHNYLLLGVVAERATGQPLQDLARERIFEPLGMRDTDFVLRDDMREKLVQRPEHAALARGGGLQPGLEDDLWRASPNGTAGVMSTARDFTAFGQMLLDDGRCGATRVLSRPSVEAMRRNHIPGVGTRFGTGWKREASYGYGLIVNSAEKWRYAHGTLQPMGAYGHAGAAGVGFWVDPIHEIVGCYTSVAMDMTELIEPDWDYDLFQNLVTSAVVS